jgi:hypothetical protein
MKLSELIVRKFNVKGVLLYTSEGIKTHLGTHYMTGGEIIESIIAAESKAYQISDAIEQMDKLLSTEGEK